jgi:hypothetical protein
MQIPRHLKKKQTFQGCEEKQSSGGNENSGNFFLYIILWSRTGLPDFLNRRNVPNDHKMYKMVIKSPNIRIVFPMAIKYSNIFQSVTLKYLPKLEFLV